jgi:hypothetical protein
VKDNIIHVIHPYWYCGSLVFDDPTVGLEKEPFVAGTDTALAMLAKAVGGCEKRFTLVFSKLAFPGHQLRATRGKAEAGGYWYRWDALGVDGWLCPALFLYFKTAPQHLYVQIKPKGATQ